MTIYLSAVMAAKLHGAASSGPMDSKDSFMRFVVIGSIVVGGVFALIISLRS
jgi:hypothetical protein